MGAVSLVVVVVICILYTPTAAGASFKHMGCYKVTAGVEGIRYNYARLKLGECAAGCSESGYPFLSLRDGRDCLCVTTFGQRGLAPRSSLCSFTCRADGVIFLCGGGSYENVYYAVDADVAPQRTTVVRATALNFNDARMSCVRGNGDLPMLRTGLHLDALWRTAIDLSQNGSGVWVNVYRSAWNQGAYRWGGLTYADPTTLLDVTAGSTFWAGGESHTGDCVVLRFDTKRLMTVSCNETFPSICLQIPPPPTTPAPVLTTEEPRPSSTYLESDSKFWSQHKLTVLCVALALFAFCYGGSCLFYAIAKCYKGLRARRRKRINTKTKEMQDLGKETNTLLEDEIYTGYGPSRPLTAREVDIQSGIAKPCHKPPPGVGEGKPYAQKPRPTQGDKTWPVAGAPGPIPGAPGPIPALPPNPQSRRRPRSKAESATSELLPEEWPEADPEIDFTKLSIKEIMYIKMMVSEIMPQNRQKKEKRKILIA